MKDLTKIEKPFGLLSWKTRKRLKAHGGPYERYNIAGCWVDCEPVWASDSTYRVKPHPDPTKPSIDWAAVHPDYKWLARDSDGSIWLFCEKPAIRNWSWGGNPLCKAKPFASAQPGTCDWRDSLVQRP